jgi:hypothetical protein
MVSAAIAENSCGSINNGYSVAFFTKSEAYHGHPYCPHHESPCREDRCETVRCRSAQSEAGIYCPKSQGRCRTGGDAENRVRAARRSSPTNVGGRWAHFVHGHGHDLVNASAMSMSIVLPPRGIDR